MRSLALALFRHERIITTVEKAKEVRPFVERLITLAKKGTLHARRLVISRLGPMAKAEVAPEDDDNDEVILGKLFNEIGPRFADRPGGYTRIIKRAERRLGDGGRTAYLELLKAGETKAPRRAPAPAPRVTQPPPAPRPAAPAPAPAPVETSPPATSPPPPTPLEPSTPPVEQQFGVAAASSSSSPAPTPAGSSSTGGGSATSSASPVQQEFGP
jgi:large subunit ribosomal protein L17